MAMFKAKKLILFCALIFLISSVATQADAAIVGEFLKFNVDSGFDLTGRSNITSTLVKVTPKIYFYIDREWWDSQPYVQQNNVLSSLDVLSREFESKIYPVLTASFGREWSPGIDRDEKITVLFHSMKNGDGGYFRENDEYERIQIPDSNEREMLYLPIGQIESLQLKSRLAHEFIHLITFNQKDKIFGSQEEVWLNELRAEVASTILGYDDVFEGSNLQKRVQTFLDNPSDSLTEWTNKKEDYGVANLFGQYLVDHYGIEILSGSLKSRLVGIPSINAALLQKGSNRDFSQIFTDWSVAVVLNNCPAGSEYCYLNKNLKNLRLNPTVNFLPLSGSSSLSVTNDTKTWAGNWQKFIGGNGNLNLSFNGNGNLFKVPYVLQRKDGSSSIGYLMLDNNQKGDININNFGTDSIALVIAPSIQIKSIGFDGSEPAYPFTFTASTLGEGTPPTPDNGDIPAGFTFKKNLAFGAHDISVIYLKLLLSTEGCLSGVSNTDYFASKTLAAVKCFQNKYRAEISSFAGYNIAATGFVGSGTRAQLNALLAR